MYNQLTIPVMIVDDILDRDQDELKTACCPWLRMP
jgi:hypothetical protein